MKVAVFPAMLALAVISTAASAKSNTPPARTQASTAHQDTKFLEKANQGNVDEIDLAQLALKKSSNDDVKNFAQKMIHDHTMLMDNMKPFANEAGLQPPSHPSVATEAEKLKLVGAVGAVVSSFTSWLETAEMLPTLSSTIHLTVVWPSVVMLRPAVLPAAAVPCVIASDALIVGSALYGARRMPKYAEFASATVE